LAELKKDNVEVIGVSFDSAASHQKFIAKCNLNFPLLADTDGKIADAYGVRMTGRDMARRVSFLIGLDGKIAHVTDTPNAETQLSEMKAAVERLNQSGHRIRRGSNSPSPGGRLVSVIRMAIGGSKIPNTPSEPCRQATVARVHGGCPNLQCFSGGWLWPVTRKSAGGLTTRLGPCHIETHEDGYDPGTA
jgi:CubicO group peptidase (beta-lactamase class C family)